MRTHEKILFFWRNISTKRKKKGKKLFSFYFDLLMFILAKLVIE
jgi:hypothetical protein